MEQNIQYLTDHNGNKKAVQIPYKDWVLIEKELKKLTDKELFFKGLKESLSNKKKRFFKFVKQHSFDIPEDYKFNRNELYER